MIRMPLAMSPKTTLLALALATTLPAFAQDAAKDAAKPAAPPEMSAEQKAMMEAYQKAGALGEAHAALKKTEGDYDLVIKSWDGPGEPTVETGKANRKMILGGRVLAEHVESQMQGQAWQGHGMHGYDNVSGRHWSTWNDSMSTGVMISDGTCDAAGACAFTGSWSDPMGKGKIHARMTSRWTDANTELFEMYTTAPGGKETKMMEITYKRRAK